MSVDCKTVWANLITGDIRGAPVSSSWQQLRPGCASVKTAQLQPVVQPPWPTMSWRAKDACQRVRDLCPWCVHRPPCILYPPPLLTPPAAPPWPALCPCFASPLHASRLKSQQLTVVTVRCSPISLKLQLGNHHLAS